MQNVIKRDEYLKRKNRVKINTGNSDTPQDKLNQCDINRIMARAKKNGIMPNFNQRKLIYADFASLPTYQESLNKVIAMENEFQSLPAKTRKEFDNDPQKLLDFVLDPKNEEKAIELQLLPKPVFGVKKLETPEGDFWVTTRNDVEIKRVEIKKTTV